MVRSETSSTILAINTVKKGNGGLSGLADTAREGRDDANPGCSEDRGHRPAAESEQPAERRRQDDDLPDAGQLEAEGNGRSRDRADSGRACAAQEGLRPLAGPEPVGAP